MDKNIAIIGCGAIGSELAVNIDQKKIRNCRISAIFDVDSHKLNILYEKLSQKPTIFSDFDSFINSINFKELDLVIEAASIQAARKYCLNILEKGKDIMIMSVGAFSDSSFYHNVYTIVNNGTRNVFLPSGAIGGIDILRSIKNQIEEITLVTTKNNKSLKGAPFLIKNEIDIDNILEEKVIFNGNAMDAIEGFPANVNVSALISLAGIGFSRTNVKVVLDPNISNNKHEISVKWRFGEFYLKVVNNPSPANPKTSYLAILSALECLRNVCSSDLKIGS